MADKTATLDAVLKEAVDLENITIEEVLENLRCSKEGLTTEAAEERLGIFGHNKLEEKKMSSTAGKCPVPGQTVGSASKFSLNGYLYTLRSELIQKGINVTAVCPGPIAMKPLFKGTNSAEQLIN